MSCIFLTQKKIENKHITTLEIACRIRKISFIIILVQKRCEGCFCVGATCRAEGDHNVDLGLEKKEEPKFNRGPKIRPKG